MKIKYTLGLLVLIICTNTVFSKVLSLKEFVKSYVKKSQTLLEEFYNTQKKKAGIKKAKGIEDFIIGVNSGLTYAKSVNQVIYTLDYSQNYGIGMSVRKILPWTGTILSVSHDFNYAKSKVGASPYLPSYQGKEMNFYMPNISFSVIQPILKNFFGFSDRLPKRLAYIDEKIQKLTYQESLEKQIVTAISIYLDWLYLYQQRIILKEIIQNNQNLLVQTKAKVRAGIAQVSDLEVARINVITFQNSLIEIENAYQNVQMRMDKYLKMEKNDEPETKILEKRPVIGLKDFNNFNQLMAIEMLNLIIRQLAINLDNKKYNLAPELNLIGSYSMAGKKEGLGDSYSDIKTNELYIGFELTWLLGNNTTKGELKEIDAEYKKMIKRKIDTEKELRINEKSLRNNVLTYQKLVREQKRYIDALEKKLKDENRQYKRGILSLREIVRTANDLANAKLQLTYFIIEYHKSFYNYLEMIDQIRNKYQSYVPVMEYDKGK